MDEETQAASAPKWAGPYRQTRSIGSKSIGGLRLIVAISAIAIGVKCWYLVEVNDEFLGESLHPAEFTDLFLVVVAIPLYLFNAICFCRWKHRSYANLPALGVDWPRYSPNWAVGSYFVPILNFFRPYRAMKDIWNGSSGLPLESRATPVSYWWMAWIVMGIAQRAANRTGIRADSVDDLRIATVVEVLACLVTIAAAVLASRVLREVTDRQEARAAELGLTQA